MSHIAYSRSCKSCDKVITIGFDSRVQRWRPWDDYDAGINHQCSGAAKKLQQQSVKVDDNNAILDKLNTITNNQATMMWILQKIATKLGVEA